MTKHHITIIVVSQYLARFLHYGMTCSYPNELNNKDCSNVTTIDWYEIPPYIYRNQTTGEISGILKNVTEMIMHKCCGTCVKFDYNNPTTDPDELQKRIGRSDAVVSVPIYGTMGTDDFNGFPYIPVVESPGIIYVKKRPYVGKASELLLQSVTDCWPILILIFFMSALFGIITWATDSYINPEQFPTPFFKGTWDGFWWALVSMTTVGYGDKAPRGLVARIIAFVWILIGLVLFSVFSGYVSTSSTASALGSEINLYGKNVTAFNNSQEQRYGIKSNAKVILVSTLTEFIRLINSGTVDGGLIDSYYAGYYKDVITQSDLIVGTVLDYQFTYGIVLSNTFHTKQMQRCVVKEVSLQESHIINLIENSMTALPELTDAELAELSTALFDENSPIFQDAVTVIGIILVMMMICGLLWEIFINQPEKRRLQLEEETEREKKVSCIISDVSAYKTMEELTIAQNMEIEQAMIDELNMFLRAFRRREADFRSLLFNPMFKKLIPKIMEGQEINL